jgi:hypothetical protein
MSTTSEVLWQEEDDIAEAANEEPVVDRRRLLLSGAAGTLVFAASGLFLPDWLAEAEAREGALDGAQGGRRGQNHRGRHRKRTHGDRKKKHKNRKPGDVVPTHPAIVVQNLRTATVQTRGLQRETAYRNWYVPNGWDWDAIPPKIADNNFTIKEFMGGWEEVVVQIGADRVVRFDFSWPFPPSATIYSGGWEWDGWRPQGEQLAHDRDMFINDSISAPGITATRIKDDYSPADNNGHVWLQVRLT